MGRAQIAMEFIILIGMAMIIMVIFLSVFDIIIKSKNEEIRDELFNDLGESIQQELLLALVMNDGYYRTLHIPPTRLNQSYASYNYTINASDGRLKIVRDDDLYSFEIPEIQGELIKGENNITKRGGTIYANQ